MSNFLAKYSVGLITSPISKAETLASILLKERLIACANIIPKVKSMYWWEDKIQTDEEALLIIKTEINKQKEIIECVKKNHEYQVPEVIFMEIKDGNEDYLQWITKEITNFNKPQQ
ncbi:hypothetical protein ABK040_001003 [Willaertia magna]